MIVSSTFFCVHVCDLIVIVVVVASGWLLLQLLDLVQSKSMDVKCVRENSSYCTRLSVRSYNLFASFSTLILQLLFYAQLNIVVVAAAAQFNVSFLIVRIAIARFIVHF